MKSYSNYKETNMFWSPSIPSNWNEIKVKHLFYERSEKGFPNEPLLSATQSRGVIPTSSFENRTVVATKGFETLKLVEIGDFVISLRSFQGGIEYAYYRGIISPAYTVMTPKNLIYKGYFKYLAKSNPFIDLLKTCVTGIREGQTINYSLLKKSSLPVPSKEEQIQIERYLDYKISKINKFIKSKKREIELLKELKQAEINRAVTKGLNPNVPMKDSGIGWLGEIPEHWAVRRLKYAANFNPALEIDINLQDDTIVSFMPMECLRTDYIEKREANYKDAKGYVPFQNGDVVMAKVTPCFENRNIAVALELVNEVGFGTSEIFVFRCTEVLSNKFLMYFLQTEYFRNNAIASMTGTGGLKRVSPKVARNIQLPLPDISEQLEIVELLENKCNSIEKMVSAIINENEYPHLYLNSFLFDAEAIKSLSNNASPKYRRLKL